MRYFDVNNTKEPNIMLSAALKLAKRGFYIHPSPKKNGAARIKWSTGSTRDLATITRWWTEWPHDLICLNCGLSKVAVIDADSPEGHGVDGLNALLDLELNNEFLPKTLMARTPSGGEHYFFHDPHGAMRNSAGTLAPGVDTRGVGGMVVLSPSIVEGKGRYNWVNNMPMAVLPEWIVEKVGKPARREVAEESKYDPAYTDEQFEARLALIDVNQFSHKHEEWLSFMLACTHPSTVGDGMAAFIAWTTEGGRGEYASEVEAIEARWNYNCARRNKAGNARTVGTFNKYLVEAGYAHLVLLGDDNTAAQEFLDDHEEGDGIKTVATPEQIAKQAAKRAAQRLAVLNGEAPPKPRQPKSAKLTAKKRAKVVAAAYWSETDE